MQIAIVAGTRPEVVKLAPVWTALHARPECRALWLSTGQQGELNAQALSTFGIKVDICLEPPCATDTVGNRFAQMMAHLDRAFGRLGPDLVLVQGDTSTTAAGAMAAFARRIPIGHVEAGLRTFDLNSPFPEEGWRRVVGQLAALHFAPTEAAAGNLFTAGVPRDRVHVTGNTGVDAVRLMGDHIVPAPTSPGLRRVLVTVHRRENWGPQFETILRALLAIRDRIADVEIVFVSHANPELKARVAAIIGQEYRIRILEPLDYTAFLAQMKSATLLLSDSGGVQEEAPLFGVPVLVLRDTTERGEGLTAGVARLVGTDTEPVIAAAVGLLNDEAERLTMVRSVSPFGDGFAAGRIAEAIVNWRATAAPGSRTSAVAA